jgi:Fic family protein
MFKPNFQITPEITKFLMAIEADRQAVEGLPVDIEMIASLRESARLNATHYSTQIEGNRLTLPQVDEVVKVAPSPGASATRAKSAITTRLSSGSKSSPPSYTP